MSKCVCAISPYCQTPATVNSLGFINHKDRIHEVPGSIRRCIAIDSLLSSSIQCLYEDSGNFPFLVASLYNMFDNDYNNPSLTSDFGPLIYDPATTRFPPPTNVSVIFKKMMIEQWNPSISYKSFYELCAPSYCTYSRRMHTHSFLEVVMLLMSMIGGIMFSLRIVIPHLVQVIIKLLMICKRNKQHQRREQVRLNYFNRMKITIQKLIQLLSGTLVGLNIFSLRDMGSGLDQLRAKQYGRWATRLYSLLFLSSFTSLIFYTVIRPHSVTKPFDQPSFILYEQLQQTYGNELKCSCSQIASTFNKFVEITPIFHPICSSQFISEEWYRGLMHGFNPNISMYPKNDYRRFLFAHLQYLRGLCQISKDSVNNAIDEFLTSLLVTVELFSKEQFHHRIKTLIEQSEANAPILFSRFLYMIQTFNHGNAYMTTYGTNFQYVSLMPSDDVSYAHTQAMAYDDNCSCGLSSNCTTQAAFIEKSTINRIVGLKMGCLPSESFQSSTLECFYNRSCLQLLDHYTNYQHSSIPLSTNLSSFLTNSTINDLISHAFIEEWSPKLSFPSYYNQCLPSLCLYTYTEKFKILYLITLFLRLQGGLTLVLTWLCPKTVRIILKIYHYHQQKRRRALVHPDISLSVLSNDINTRTKENETSQERTMSPVRRYPKIVVIISLLILLLIGIIIFSIYYARNVSMKNKTTIGNSNTTTTSITTTTMPISSTTSEPLCQDEFQQISTNISCFEHDENNFHITTADFDNNNLVDLVYSCRSNQNEEIIVLLSNGNGTFQSSIILLLSISHWIGYIYVVDFNNDNQSDVFLIHGSKFIIVLGNGDGTFQSPREFLDEHIDITDEVYIADFNNDNQYDVLLIRSHKSKENLVVFLGGGNGTFQTHIMISSTVFSSRVGKTVVYDLNNDQILDIVIGFGSDKNVGVVFGHGDGSFSSEVILFKENTIYPLGLAVTDMNNDHYIDIVIYDEDSKHVYVLFGSANGTYQAQNPFFTTIIMFYHFLVIDDFDNDNQSDIAFLYSLKDTECMIYHYHNNSFKRNEKTVIKLVTGLDTVIARDINNDNYLDIILGTRDPNKIYALFGYGNDRFYSHMIYSHIADSDEDSLSPSWLGVGDFNDDNSLDIVSANYDTLLIDVFLYKRACSID